MFPESFAATLDHLTLLMLPLLLVVLGALAAKEGWIETVHNKIYAYKRMKKLLKRSWKKPSEGAVIFGVDKLGRLVYSPNTSEAHMAVIGGSGTGKTSGLIIPSLRTMKGCTGYIPDISGDIYTNVPGLNSLIYDPTNPDSRTKYNVFSMIDSKRTESEKNIEIQRLIELFFPDKASTDDAGRYFYQGGKDIVLATFLAFYHQGKDFPEICQKIQNADYNTLFSEIVQTGNKKAVRYIQQFRGQSEKNISGCYGEAVKVIALFADEDLMGGKLGRGAGSISAECVNECFFVLNVPLDRRETYIPLIKLITGQVMQAVALRSLLHDKTKAKMPACFLFLDEASSLLRGSASIEGLLLTGLATYRKLSNVRICIAFQSISDLRVYYSKPDLANITIDNVKFVCVLGAFDPSSRTFFADLVGKKAVKVGKETKYEYIAPPDAFSNLEDDQMYLIWRGGYMKLRKAFYFKERRLQ